MLAQEPQLLGKTEQLCPFCGKETIEQGRNGFARCPDPVHSWIDCKTVIKLKELNTKRRFEYGKK